MKSILKKGAERTLMNCKRLQELLPLYVGRELEDEQLQKITTHVQSCEACLESANAHREVRQLIHEFEPPAFSDSFYAGLRKQVLGELETRVQSPTVPPLAGFLWPCVRWSLAAALLVAICGLAFYFSVNRGVEKQLVGTSPTANRTTDETASNSDLSRLKGSGDEKGRKNTPPKRKRVSGAELGAGKSIERSQLRKEAESLERPAKMVAGEFPVNADTSVAGTEDLPTKTLRVEILTKDQNIRIIWFSSPPNNPDSLSDSHKGI